ncbi:MAG: GtrA family protein [Patescibacteria group bacterium]
MHVDASAVKRFFQYTSIGISTFALDLALLFLFTDYLGIYYVLSAGIAFVVAVSFNYALSRRFVFTGTLRSVHGGYVIFLLIAGVGLVLVMGLMYVCVDVLGFNYILSRIFIAGVVGFWTYFMNLYMNFRVAGK